MIKLPGISIYKPTARAGRNEPYLIAYKDQALGRKVETAFADEKLTERMALAIFNRIEQTKLGLLSDRDRRFLEYQATPLLPPPATLSEPLPSQSHLEVYLSLLGARKRTRKWAQMVGSRITKLFSAASFDRIDDIEADPLELALATLADSEEWSDATAAKYQKAAKQFTRWLRTSRRARFDELESMPIREVTELVHNRRALEEKEIVKLLAAAARGEDYIWWGHRRMSGQQRELAYILALESGLRANEQRTLTPESFHLDPEPGKGKPYVVVEGRNSKHRWRDEVLLRKDTAERFRAYLSSCVPCARIWDFPDKPVDMMRFDLERAGITYVDVYGRVVDYHALRHTFCTRVAATCAKERLSPKTCQEMMRHADPRMTARYMHTTLHDHVAALESLPAIGRGTTSASAQKAHQRATGTDGATLEQLPFQRLAQRARFPKVPASSRLDPPSLTGGLTPTAKVAADAPESLLLFPSLRPPEPKVAGSTPAGNVTPTHEQIESNEDHCAESRNEREEISARGAARDDVENDLPAVGGDARIDAQDAGEEDLNSGFVNRRLGVQVASSALDASPPQSEACESAPLQKSQEPIAPCAARDLSEEIPPANAAKIAMLLEMIEELKKGGGR